MARPSRPLVMTKPQDTRPRYIPGNRDTFPNHSPQSSMNYGYSRSPAYELSSQVSHSPQRQTQNARWNQHMPDDSFLNDATVAAYSQYSSSLSAFPTPPEDHPQASSPWASFDNDPALCSGSLGVVSEGDMTSDYGSSSESPASMYLSTVSNGMFQSCVNASPSLTDVELPYVVPNGLPFAPEINFLTRHDTNNYAFLRTDQGFDYPRFPPTPPASDNGSSDSMATYQTLPEGLDRRNQNFRESPNLSRKVTTPQR